MGGGGVLLCHLNRKFHLTSDFLGSLRTERRHVTAVVHRRAEAGGQECERIKLRTASLPSSALFTACARSLSMALRTARDLRRWLY